MRRRIKRYFRIQRDIDQYRWFKRAVGLSYCSIGDSTAPTRHPVPSCPTTPDHDVSSSSPSLALRAADAPMHSGAPSHCNSLRYLSTCPRVCARTSYRAVCSLPVETRATERVVHSHMFSGSSLELPALTRHTMTPVMRGGASPPGCMPPDSELRVLQNADASGHRARPSAPSIHRSMLGSLRGGRCSSIIRAYWLCSHVGMLP